MKKLNANDIAVVGLGSVLPGNVSTSQFFEHICAGNTMIRDLASLNQLKMRPNYRFTSDPARTDPDAASTTLGADIDRETIWSLASQLGFDTANYTSLEVMLIQAINEALSPIKNWVDPKKTEAILGLFAATSDDLPVTFDKILDDIQNSPEWRSSSPALPAIKEALVSIIEKEVRRFEPRKSAARLRHPSYIGSRIQEYFGLNQTPIGVDSACASALAAISMAQRRLRQNRCLFAIAGGVDQSLGSIQMPVYFSRLGVLSSRGAHPMDASADGFVQGEGCVMFVLTLLKTAKKLALPVLAVLDEMGIASDGKFGGLTEPTVNGQILAYERAYKKFPDKAVSYVETHGTGTRLGDRTEIESLSRFFKGRTLPIGSVKSNCGHMMATAGAIGLFKAIEVIRNHKIPPSPYFKKFQEGIKTNLYLNRTLEQTPGKKSSPVSVGVSSFGFGGCNFHVAVHEASYPESNESTPHPAENRVLLCGKVSASLSEVDSLLAASRYKVPPKSRVHTNDVQLLGVVLTEKLFRSYAIDPEQLDRENCHVISGNPPQRTRDFSLRMRFTLRYLYRQLESLRPELAAEAQTAISKVIDAIPYGEDQSVLGIINNFVSARISKAFDLKGVNFNVMHDHASGLWALETARNILVEESGVAIVVETKIEFDDDTGLSKDLEMTAYLLMTEDQAKKHEIGGRYELLRLTHDQGQKNFPESIRVKTILGEKLIMELSPWRGIDFSKKCFLFPGQGIAVPGMGMELYRSEEIFRRRFDVADRIALSMKLPQISTFVTQSEPIAAEHFRFIRSLALLTFEVALFELYAHHNERPSLIMGHSFGEYACFVVSGVLSFEEVFRIVLQRDRICPEPHELGSLIAIQAPTQIIEDVLKGLEFYISNINSPKQTTVAVPAKGRELLIKALKKNSLEHKFLENVPQPYHCLLLDRQREALCEYLKQEKFRFYPPKIAFLSSVSRQLLTDQTPPEEYIRILSQQLTTQVNFIEQVRFSAEIGICNFIEVGTYEVMSPWVRTILAGQNFKTKLPDFNPRMPQDRSSQGKNKISYDSGLVGLLNKAIASVTGYSTKDITLNSNFQEDLGIDSIKKTAIILKFLSEKGELGGGALTDTLHLNRIRTVEDVLGVYIRNTTAEVPDDSLDRVFIPYIYRWEKVGNDSFEKASVSTGPVAPVYLRAAGISSDTLSTALKTLSDSPRLRHFLVIDFSYEGIDQEFRPLETVKSFRECYELLKSLGESLTLVLRLSGVPHESSGLEGFFRSLAQECNFNYRQIEGSVNESQLETELGYFHEPIVKFMDGQRFVRIISELRPPDNHPNPVNPFKGKRIVSLGGSRGLLLSLFESLGSDTEFTLYILGRSKPDEIQEAIQSLSTRRIQFQYIQCDGRESGELQAALQDISRSGQVDFVFHGAGVEFSKLLKDKPNEEILKEYETKVATFRNLLKAAENIEIRSIVVFSSIAAECGNIGQTVYALANSSLSALAEKFNQNPSNKTHIHVIAWPAWKELGMTAQEQISNHLKTTGQLLLELQAGVELLKEAVSSNIPSRVVCMPRRDINYYFGPMISKKLARLIFGDEIIFRSPLPLTRWVSSALPGLRDHQLWNKTIAPANMSLITFWLLGLALKGRYPVIRNFDAIRIIPIQEEGSSGYFLRYFSNPEGLTAEICSDTVHARSSLSFGPFVPTPNPALDKAFVADLRFRIEPREFFYGPAYTLEITGLALDKAKKVCAGKLKLDPERNKQTYDHELSNLLACMVEALLQTFGSISEVLFGSHSIPLSIETLYLCPEVKTESEYKIEIEICSIDPKQGYFNARVTSSSGQIAVSMIGAKVKLLDLSTKPGS